MTARQLSILYLVVFLFTTLRLVGQRIDVASADFRSPLDIPLLLSGTFGELRANHFHAGIDIKTQGAEGEKVFAIADGYVSRIKVSTGGYGKVIYMTHPSGFVSVYGHLKQFNDSIRKFVRNLQYKKESYTVEAFPGKNELKVKKGELIALSGNTGGSDGPHLHFEIREEATQYPLNPLFFNNITIKDQVSPRISLLAVYPLGGLTLINGKNDTAYFTVEKKGKDYVLSPHREISISGPFSLGILTYDQMNGATNKNGIFSVDLLLDEEKVFGLEMDKLSFATTRYLNSLIDYPYYKRKKRRLIRTQVDTNNRLFNYRGVNNNGIYSFSDSLPHLFQYVISDVYENRSVFSFRVESQERQAAESKKGHAENNGTFFRFSRENKISTPHISLTFPANTFYRSFYFQLKTLPAEEFSFTPVFEVHNPFTPAQKYFSVAITPDSIPGKLKDKMYIAYTPDADQAYYFMGAKWKGDKLTAKSRLQGKYAVLEDTIAPEISTVNFYPGKNVSKQHSLKVRIREKQTGIKSYRGTLNGHWILMEYKPKKNLLTYNYDEYIRKGENTFKLVVTDLLGNETVYEAVIVY
ncbi:MAG: M23 family metallopeptidase [Bacteroidales bacterium]|nr:M23 family metallopeptidase [Bacteroidales bacterium]